MPEEGGKVRDCVRGGLRGLYPPPLSEFGDSEKREGEIIIFKVKFAYLDSKSLWNL